MSAERSWESVCNGNQTVKAVGKASVNGRAYEMNLVLRYTRI